MKKKLVVEIDFDETQDAFDEDYTRLDFNSMRIVKAESTVSESQCENLAEAWGQSDWYSVGFVSAFLSMLDGDVVSAKDVRSY